jgi:hypothetical protein
VAKGGKFADRVRRWYSYHFQCSPTFILARKLEALKGDLKIWNEQVFGNVESHKRKLIWRSCVFLMGWRK